MQRPILFLCRFAARLYYRTTRLGESVPDGPLLLVGNHPNGLVDPIFLAGVAERPVRFLGKAPLFEIPVLGSLVRGVKAIPVYRKMDGDSTVKNETTFAAAHAALGDGDVICIFPEGRSHSEPRVVDLRTGAARMGLGAEVEHDFGLGVQVVPVGLIYLSKRRFRSEVAIWVGEPIRVADFQAAHQKDDREAVRALTARIAGGLRSVTLELERWDDLSILVFADKLLAREGELRWPRLRSFARNLRALRRQQPEDIAELYERLDRFRTRLQQLGIEVEDLDQEYTTKRVLGYVGRKLPLFLALPLGFVGSLFWWIPYRTVPLITRTVNPKPSVYVTVQILAGFVLFLAWLGSFGALCWWLWGPLAAAGLLLAAALLGPFTIFFWDRWSLAVGDATTFLRLSSSSRLSSELREERDQLTETVRRLRPPPETST